MAISIAVNIAIRNDQYIRVDNIIIIIFLKLGTHSVKTRIIKKDLVTGVVY